MGGGRAAGGGRGGAAAAWKGAEMRESTAPPHRQHHNTQRMTPPRETKHGMLIRGACSDEARSAGNPPPRLGPAACAEQGLRSRLQHLWGRVPKDVDLRLGVERLRKEARREREERRRRQRPVSRFRRETPGSFPRRSGAFPRGISPYTPRTPGCTPTRTTRRASRCRTRCSGPTGPSRPPCRARGNRLPYPCTNRAGTRRRRPCADDCGND